jgi:hypothetical protein
MRRFSYIFSVFVVLTGCHEAAVATVPTMGDEPTLAILGEDGVTCAAVALTATLAVTANHCVPEQEVSFVTASRTGKPDRTTFGVVVAREANSDLAVFSSSGLVPATLADGAIDYEHATTLVTHVPAPWTVAKLHPNNAREGFVQTERLETGMSGSGLWDDGGRLVGIAVGNDVSSGYFAGAGRIRRLVEAAPVKAELKPPPPTAALWGDPAFSVDDLIVSARLRREHIENSLERVERRPTE